MKLKLKNYGKTKRKREQSIINTSWQKNDHCIFLFSFNEHRKKKHKQLKEKMFDFFFGQLSHLFVCLVLSSIYTF